MITVIELVCKNWEHEEVNAGLLRLIECCSDKDKKIAFFSDPKHGKAVSSLCRSNNIIYNDIENDSRFMEESEVFKCINLINQFIKKYPSKIIFFSAAYYPEIKAIKLIAKLRKDKKFYICLHGMLEEKFGKQACYDDLICSEQSNVFYITYSKNCQERYKNRGVNNIFFLHHPFIQARCRNRKKSENTRIGIVGGCANVNAIRFIDYIKSKYRLNDKIEFRVMSNNIKSFRKYKNCIVSSDFGRYEMELIMSEIDYLLIPYGKDEYRLSASGVMWDAVSNRVPIIGYDSPYLLYYQDKIKIGYINSSLKELVQTLDNIIHLKIDDKNYFEGLNCLENENEIIIGKIVRG